MQVKSAAGSAEVSCVGWDSPSEDSLVPIARTEALACQRSDLSNTIWMVVDNKKSGGIDSSWLAGHSPEGRFDETFAAVADGTGHECGLFAPDLPHAEMPAIRFAGMPLVGAIFTSWR